MWDAVYNSPIHPPINLRINLCIPGMLSPLSSRFFSILLFALLFVVEATRRTGPARKGCWQEKSFRPPARKPWPWKY